MIIEIDPSAGFCMGVNKAIEKAEHELKKGFVCSLGDLLHNHEEVNRLEQLGLKTITEEVLGDLNGQKILIRTHGEPPEVFSLLEKNEVQIIDATCPIVKKLQQRIRKSSLMARDIYSQVLIYGKKDHPEVLGLVGHSDYFARVIEKEEDLRDIDFERSIELFAQTTAAPEGFTEILSLIKAKIVEHGGDPDEQLKVFNTICGHVTKREKLLRKFAKVHEVVVFVSGRNSSNGKRLFSCIQEVNPKSYFISHPVEIEAKWFEGMQSIGISGATSTPGWLLGQVKDEIEIKLSPLSGS